VTGNSLDSGLAGSEESEPTGLRVTDKRRVDPQTGAVRHPGSASGAKVNQAAGSTEVAGVALEGDDVHPDTTLAADLTRDLQRLQAEYVNYKRRVDRDRVLHRDMAVGSVIEALLPVLDDIHLARQHGDLEGGPFAAIADKLDGTLTQFAVERFGQPGDAFDPTMHEALMHTEAELAKGTEVTTVVQVLQPGYRMGQRIIRAARVAVADPQPDQPSDQPPDQPPDQQT
jgi:molecular chaperone GrpE